MKTIITAVILIIISISFWVFFKKSEKIPSSQLIESVVIAYNEVGHELFVENQHKSKIFNISEEQEIDKILGLLKGVQLSKLPFFDDEKSSKDENWIINLNYKNGNLRYIFVNKSIVSNLDNKDSEIYFYLKNKYSE